MDLFQQSVRKVLFPLQELVKGHSTNSILYGLEQSQWWSAQHLQELQNQKLRLFLDQIDSNVPYYSNLCVSDYGVNTVKDLTKLPPLDKDLIRANSYSLRSNKAGKLRENRTGGSSGEPLIFYVGNHRISHDVAARCRANRWWGVDVGDRELVLWGSPIEIGAQDRVRKLRDTLMRSRLLPAFAMSQERLPEFAQAIREYKPRMVFGYPSALAYLAQWCLQHAPDLANSTIKAAFVTSEMLLPQQREAIAQAFGCAVVNEYGGRDSGFVARECAHGGFHINAEDIIVEIIDDNGVAVTPGEIGEVVITHLASEDFPFLRYRTGDLAALDISPCECGRHLPKLKEIAGRQNDLLVAVDGTRVHGNSVNYIVRRYPDVLAYKVIQQEDGTVNVLLETGPEFGEQYIEPMRGDFKQRLGESAQVSIELVGAVPPEPNGKRRYVISHVPAAGA